MTATKKTTTEVDAETSTRRGEALRALIMQGVEDMQQNLLEREGEIHCCVLALLANEHILLLGPPGEAKSLLSDTISSWLSARRFRYQLNRFTQPNEIFGPINLDALAKGHNEVCVDGYLPSCDIGFIDEVFKGSSAILNTLLMAAEERRFEYGTQKLDIPLRCLVGASNEVPNDQEAAELAALFDRFLIRRYVNPLSDAGFSKLVSGVGSGRDFRTRFRSHLSLAELGEASSLAMKTPLGEAASQTLLDVRQALREKTMAPSSSRRWAKCVKLAKASAWLSGSAEVEPHHLECLADCLWHDPTPGNRGQVASIVEKIANPAGAEISELWQQAQEVIAACKMGDPHSGAETVAKLKDIHSRLKKVPGGNGRAAAAAAKVSAEGSRIYKAYMEKVFTAKPF